MGLLQLQFRRIFDGDNTFTRVNQLRNGVQHGGFTGTRTAGYQDIQPTTARNTQHGGRGGRHILLSLHHVEGDFLLGEFTDGNRRTINGERRNDDIHSAAICKTGIHQRIRFVNTPPHMADDPPRNLHHMGIVTKLAIGQHQLAFLFDKHLLGTIDHNIGDALIGEQRLQRTKAEHVMHQAFGQLALLALIKLDPFLDQDIRDNIGNITRQIETVHGHGGADIDTLHQQRLDRLLDAFQMLVHRLTGSLRRHRQVEQRSRSYFFFFNRFSILLFRQRHDGDDIFVVIFLHF